MRKEEGGELELHLTSPVNTRDPQYLATGVVRFRQRGGERSDSSIPPSSFRLPWGGARDYIVFNFFERVGVPLWPVRTRL